MSGQHAFWMRSIKINPESSSDCFLGKWMTINGSAERIYWLMPFRIALFIAQWYVILLAPSWRSKMMLCLQPFHRDFPGWHGSSHCTTAFNLSLSSAFKIGLSWSLLVHRCCWQAHDSGPSWIGWCSAIHNTERAFLHNTDRNGIAYKIAQGFYWGL